jgi:hypothetical protein
METNNDRLPKVDIYGNEIPKDSIFFKIPENIGTILFATTSFSEGQRPLTKKELDIKFIKWSAILMAIAGIIIFLGKITDPLGIIILLGLPLLIALWVVNRAKKFQHACWYIGDNGYAVADFIDSMDNVWGAEFCFDNATDLFATRTAKYVNGGYTHTDYTFMWCNNENIVYKIENKYVNEHDDPTEFPILYHFFSLAEKQWTNKLISNMYNELKNNGFIQFYYIRESFFVTIKLGTSYIELVPSNDKTRELISNKYRWLEGTRRFEKDEIKEIYLLRGYINFVSKEKEKVEVKSFWGLKTEVQEQDKSSGICLQYVSNQSYFWYVLQTLWADKIIEMALDKTLSELEKGKIDGR